MIRDLAAVALGGVIGTGMRLGLDALLPHADDAFPWPTLIVNTLGAFVLGVLVARFWDRASSWLRAGLGAGMLGSFTTFSAIAVALVSLAVADAWLLAAALLLASLIAGFAAAWLGIRLGRPRGEVTIDLVDE